MEVIKKGNKNYIYYKRCRECGSIISFMRSELDWSRRFICPICRNTVYTGLYEDYESDPYLGDEEVKKEVEDYLANKEKTEAPNRKPVYVPKKKGEVTIKVDPDSIDEIVNTIKDSSEFEGVLEKILREVKAESIPPCLRDGKPYEPSKTTDRTDPPYEPSKTNGWGDPYSVTIRNL